MTYRWVNKKNIKKNKFSSKSIEFSTSTSTRVSMVVKTMKTFEKTTYKPNKETLMCNKNNQIKGKNKNTKNCQNLKKW